MPARSTSQTDQGPMTTGTPCDASRCTATALVMVEKRIPWPEGRTPGRPDATMTGSLAFCGHDYNDRAALLGLDGWRVVADLRTWKPETAS